jgi:phosphohistidine phosphatase SixA
MLHGNVSSVERPEEDTLTMRAITAIRSAAALAAAAFIALAGPVARSAGGAPLAAPELIERLRAGGCVLVMRHAQSPDALPNALTAKADNPHRERQLDAAGEAGARAFGAAVRALHVPIGPVDSSPTYRARETVRLAGLGEPRLIEQLAESKRGMSGAAERSQIEWLRRAVRRHPPRHSNTLIVTHTPNIVGAFGGPAAGIQAGESLVFEPRRAGGARLLGRITVAEWQRLADELAGRR